MLAGREGVSMRGGKQMIGRFIKHRDYSLSALPIIGKVTVLKSLVTGWLIEPAEDIVGTFGGLALEPVYKIACG